MEVITLPDGGDVALDEHIRALFQLQSQALKAAHARADAFQLRIDALEQQAGARRHDSHDAGDSGGAPPLTPSHDPARAATDSHGTHLSRRRTRSRTSPLQLAAGGGSNVPLLSHLI